MNREIPQTSAEEMFAPEAFVAALAIGVQSDYLEHMGFQDGQELVDWIATESPKFRKIISDCIKSVLQEEDFADAIGQARRGDDHILRAAILRHVIDITTSRVPKL